MRSTYKNTIVITLAVVSTFVLFTSQSRPADRPHLNKGEDVMTTREIIQAYFTALEEKKGWALFLADDMVFTSFTSPVKHVAGKGAYLEATKRFYSSIISMEVRDLLVEGERACALTHYELRSPKGNAFTSDVAESFTVKNGEIVSFAIYFDSAPFPK